MSLLKEYYDSIASENAAKVNLSNAQAQQTIQQSEQIGPNAQSQRDLEAAQASSALAGAANQSAQAGQVGANAASERGLNTSRINNNNVQSTIASTAAPFDNALKGAQTGLVNQNIQAGTYNLPGYKDPQGFEQGGKVGTKPSASAVPGKGKPGPTDTVPTMLTPGEGVLNKGAVEHYGLGTLNHMNAMGLKRMGAQSELAQHLGLPDPHAAPGKPAGGKVGAKGVPGKAAGGTPPSKRAGYATGGLVDGGATPGGTTSDILALFAPPRSPATGGMPMPAAQGLTPLTRETTTARETPRR